MPAHATVSIRLTLRYSLCSLSTLVGATLANADSLPYTVRTHAYSGGNILVNGDVRTVGMAGATVGLPDTFLSTTDNPAGLTMLLMDGDINISGNTISDSHIQNSANPISTGSFGLALNTYPWGFSAGYLTASREGQIYELPGLLGQSANMDIKASEFKLGVSRLFLREKLALGVSLNVGQAEEQLDPGPSGNDDAHDVALGATFGAMIRFPRHWVGGISYQLPMHYSFASRAAADPTPEFPGFFQPLNSPPRFGIGGGWIPNRFARVSLSLFAIGATPGAALLQNQQIAVGNTVTFQPRIGAAYNFLNYKEISGTLFAGTYFEMTRIDGSSNRVHITSGIELHPWIFTIGAGADLSAGYSNFLTGIGFDIFKALAKLDIIPTPYQPPYKGLMPNPAHLRDEGLPRPLVKHWKKHGPDMNPFKVIREVPSRTSKKFDEVKKMIVNPTPPPAEGEDDDSDEN